MTRLRFLRRLPHALLALMLAVGLVVQPVLGVIGELHAADHRVAAASSPGGEDEGASGPHDDHGHGDRHGHGHRHGGAVSGIDIDIDHDGHPDDPEHTAGVHGLLHAGGGVPAALPDTALRIASPQAVPTAAAAPPVFHATLARPDLPLRPPIG